jgi:phasin family protein
MADLLSRYMACERGFVTGGWPWISNPARLTSFLLPNRTSRRIFPMAFPPTSMADFGEFGKLFADMKMPAVPGMEAFVAASRRNVETLTAANKVALEGAQTVARRHMEIIQQNMAELTEAMRALSTLEAPQAKAAKQAELLKQAYEHAVANMKELGDLIQQSNAEAVKLLNERFVEAMDEIKVLAEKAKG